MLLFCKIIEKLYNYGAYCTSQLLSNTAESCSNQQTDVESCYILKWWIMEQHICSKKKRKVSLGLWPWGGLWKLFHVHATPWAPPQWLSLRLTSCLITRRLVWWCLKISSSEQPSCQSLPPVRPGPAAVGGIFFWETSRIYHISIMEMNAWRH